MTGKVLEEKDINQEYVIYFYKIELYNRLSLKKEVFATEADLKKFIIDKKNYNAIEDIYIDGKRVYFKLDTTVELIYQ